MSLLLHCYYKCLFWNSLLKKSKSITVWSPVCEGSEQEAPAAATRCMTQSCVNHTVSLPPHISEHCSLQSLFIFFLLSSMNTHTYTHIYARRLTFCLLRAVDLGTIRSGEYLSQHDGVGWSDKEMRVQSHGRKCRQWSDLTHLHVFFFFPLVEHSGTGETDVGHRGQSGKKKSRKNCSVHLGLVSNSMGKFNWFLMKKEMVMLRLQSSEGRKGFH